MREVDRDVKILERKGVANRDRQRCRGIVGNRDRVAVAVVIGTRTCAVGLPQNDVVDGRNQPVDADVAPGGLDHDVVAGVIYLGVRDLERVLNRDVPRHDVDLAPRRGDRRREREQLLGDDVQVTCRGKRRVKDHVLAACQRDRKTGCRHSLKGDVVVLNDPQLVGERIAQRHAAARRGPDPERINVGVEVDIVEGDGPVVGRVEGVVGQRDSDRATPDRAHAGARAWRGGGEHIGGQIRCEPKGLHQVGLFVDPYRALDQDVGLDRLHEDRVGLGAEEELPRQRPGLRDGHRAPFPRRAGVVADMNFEDIGRHGGIEVHDLRRGHREGRQDPDRRYERRVDSERIGRKVSGSGIADRDGQHAALRVDVSRIHVGGGLGAVGSLGRRCNPDLRW